jgi:hypothetical protein
MTYVQTVLVIAEKFDQPQSVVSFEAPWKSGISTRRNA